MAGYTRQDTANNIANGSVIDADDLDGEFNAVESAFNASSGHSHDGTSGDGGPILKVGPGQDLIVGTSTVLPKTNNTLDLGSNAAAFKDGWFDGTLTVDNITIGNQGYTQIDNNLYTVSTGSLTVDVAGDITLDADGGDILFKDAGVSFGKLSNNSNQLSIYSGSIEALRLNGSATSALGTLAVTGNTTVGGTFVITGATTASSISASGAVSATGGFTGDLTGNVTGTVSNVTNHDTGDITEGSNLYHTTARARGAISATGSLNYNNTTGVMSFTQGNTDTITEGSSNLYHTTARARGAISATGNLSYNSSTGVVSLATDQNVIFNNITANNNIAINTGSLILADGVRAKFGNSSDLSIYHDPGANFPISYIQEQTGHLYVWVTGVNKDFVVSVNNGSGSQLNLIKADGSSQNVTLKQGSTTRLETTTSGVTVTGALTATSFIGNASTATALATARTIALSGDVTGSVSFNGTSNATITATITDDSHTHDGRYYTETESDTRFTASGGDTMTGNLKFNDNVKAVFGTDDDVDMHYDNSHMYMDLKTGTSNFYIRDNTTNIFTFNDSGNFTASGNVTAYSDERLKSDIVTIPNALETVSKLRGVNFIKDGKASTGVIAQEVQKVIPEVVLEGEEYLSVAYGNLVGVLIEAVKELKEEVQQLKDGSI
tara:strand:+ start:449 stop:2443 length:1995 start_codon:yes stop_codon:yes gene_type:complete